MIRTIYLAAKPGDARLYPFVNGIAEETAEALVREGFQILAVDVFLPTDFGDKHADESFPTRSPIEPVNARRIR